MTGNVRYRPRADLLRDLRPLFDRFPADIVLRGSVARQDMPYDDLDIAVITTRDRSLIERMPPDLDGLPIHYSHLPRPLLPDFFETYPRCWDLAVDGVPLREHDPGVSQQITEQRVVMYDRQLPDTVFFLLYEDLEPRRHGEATDYATRKGLHGGRHTITRCLFLLRALYPELRPLSTSEELLAAARAVIPAGMIEHVQRVNQNIRRADITMDELLTLFAPISAWRADLARQTRPLVESGFEPAYLVALAQANEPLSGKAARTLAEYALSPMRKSHSYILLTTLATNPDLPAGTIMMLWERFRHDTVYRGLLRRLARHPRFPRGREADSALSAADLELTRRLRLR